MASAQQLATTKTESLRLCQPLSSLRHLCGPHYDIGATKLLIGFLKLALERRQCRSVNAGRLLPPDAVRVLSCAFDTQHPQSPTCLLGRALLQFALSLEHPTRGCRSCCNSCGCVGSISSCEHRIYCSRAKAGATAILTHPAAIVDSDCDPCPLCGFQIWRSCNDIAAAAHISACFDSLTVRCRKPSRCQSCVRCTTCGIKTPVTEHTTVCGRSKLDLILTLRPMCRSSISEIERFAFRALQPYLSQSMCSNTPIPLNQLIPPDRNSFDTPTSDQIITSLSIMDPFADTEISSSSFSLSSPHTNTSNSGLANCLYPYHPGVIDLGQQREIRQLCDRISNTEPAQWVIDLLPFASHSIATEIAKFVAGGNTIYVEIGNTHMVLPAQNSPRFGTIRLNNCNSFNCIHSRSGSPKKPRYQSVFNPTREPPSPTLQIRAPALAVHHQHSVALTEGDGNCLFVSVLSATNSTTPTLALPRAKHLRWKCWIHQIENYATKYAHALGVSGELPLHSARPKSFGTITDVMAISEVLDQRIYVHSHGDQTLCYPDSAGSGIHLLHSGNHFEPIWESGAPLTSTDVSAQPIRLELTPLDLYALDFPPRLPQLSSSDTHQRESFPQQTGEPSGFQPQLSAHSNQQPDSEQPQIGEQPETESAVDTDSDSSDTHQQESEPQQTGEPSGSAHSNQQPDSELPQIGEQPATDSVESQLGESDPQTGLQSGFELQSDSNQQPQIGVQPETESGVDSDSDSGQLVGSEQLESGIQPEPISDRGEGESIPTGGNSDNFIDMDVRSPDTSPNNSDMEFLDDFVHSDNAATCNRCNARVASHTLFNNLCVLCSHPRCSTPIGDCAQADSGMESRLADTSVLETVCVCCMSQPPSAGSLQCDECRSGPTTHHAFCRLSSARGDFFTADKGDAIPVEPGDNRFPIDDAASAVTAYYSVHSGLWYSEHSDNHSEFYLYEYYNFYRATPPSAGVSITTHPLSAFVWTIPAKIPQFELPNLYNPSEQSELAAISPDITTRPLTPRPPASATQQMMQKCKDRDYACKITAASVRMCVGIERGLLNLRDQSGAPTTFHCLPAGICSVSFDLNVAAAEAICRLNFCFVPGDTEMLPIYYICRSQEAMCVTQSGNSHTVCEVFKFDEVAEYFQQLSQQLRDCTTENTLGNKLRILLNNTASSVGSKSWCWDAVRILSILRERRAIEAGGARLMKIISNLQLLRHYTVYTASSSRIDSFTKSLCMSGREIIAIESSPWNFHLKPRFTEVSIGDLSDTRSVSIMCSDQCSSTRLSLLIKAAHSRAYSDAGHHTSETYHRCDGYRIPIEQHPDSKPCTIFLPPGAGEDTNLDNLNRAISALIASGPQNEIDFRLHHSESKLATTLVRHIAEFGDACHAPETLTIPFVPYHAVNQLHAHAYFCQSLPTVLYSSEDTALILSLSNLSAPRKTIDAGPMYASGGVHSAFCTEFGEIARDVSQHLYFLNININFPAYMDIPETYAKADLAAAKLPALFAKLCQMSKYTPHLLMFCIETHTSNVKYKKKKTEVEIREDSQPGSEFESALCTEIAERGNAAFESGAIGMCGVRVSNNTLHGSAHIHCLVAFHSPTEILSSAVSTFLFEESVSAENLCESESQIFVRLPIHNL